MKARAAIAHGDGRFSIDTVTVNDPGPGEVLVALKASGICHTDYDSLRWGKDLILGHEGAGIVLKVGADVTRIRPADRVVLNWAIPCKKCYQCQLGNQNLCETNSPVIRAPYAHGHAHPHATLHNGSPISRSFNLGTLSTHTVVREEAVISIAEDIPFASACIIGCGVMTGYGSVVNAARLQPGSSAVVIGSGGVGLNVIQGARIAGAAKIIAIDVNSERLKMALQFGATHTITATRQDQGLLQAAEQVRKICDGRGADYAFECTAIPELGSAPLAMVRNAGTAIQVSGIEQTIPFDMNLFEWDKIYLNPLYGKAVPELDFPKILELYRNRKLLLDELVTRTYALAQLNEAFEDMRLGRNAKGVVLFDE